MAALGFTVYFPETRGLEWSTWLNCPGHQPGLDGKCLESLVQQWGRAGVQQFSLSNAARDVAFMMKATLAERPPRPVHLYGVSFGTALANRVLQVADVPVRAAVTTVTLDSIFAPHFAQIQASDQNYAWVGDRIFGECDVDPYCGAAFANAFGRTSTVMLEQVFHEVASGGSAYHCLRSAGIATPSVLGLKGALIAQVGAEGFFQRVLAVPIIFRIARCNANDVLILRHIKELFVPMDLPDVWPGDALMANMFLSPDFWMQDNPLYTPLQLQTYALHNRFSNFSDYGLRLRSAWAVYPPDLFLGLPAPYTMPTLLLNGLLDANTAIGWAAGLASRIPDAHFVAVPYAPHVVLSYTPMRHESGSCGAKIILSFIISQGATVDTACLADLLPLDFAAETTAMKEVAQDTLGTTNLFGL